MSTATAPVALGASVVFCEEKTPARDVELVVLLLATEKGDLISLMVALMSVSYEKPVWTGWSMYSMLTSTPPLV